MPKVIRTVLASGNRNESTANYSRSNIFLSGNRYRTAVFNNDTGADIVLEDGLMLTRNTTTVANVNPVTAATDFPNVIGIARFNGELLVADGESVNINYAFNGEIDSNLLVFPAATSLDTVVTGENKILADKLNDLGFVLSPVQELGVFDN